jgi:hypothetical protein
MPKMTRHAPSAARLSLTKTANLLAPPCADGSLVIRTTREATSTRAQNPDGSIIEVVKPFKSGWVHLQGCCRLQAAPHTSHCALACIKQCAVTRQQPCCETCSPLLPLASHVQHDSGLEQSLLPGWIHRGAHQAARQQLPLWAVACLLGAGESGQGGLHGNHRRWVGSLGS